MFSSKDISYYIISLGCAKNLVDAERINGEMKSAGFSISKTSEAADIIIVNTCGFIQDAKEESIEVIFDALGQQRAESASGGFGRKVAVIGCLTQRYHDAVMDEIPEIDFVYGILDAHFVKELSSYFNIDIEPVRTCREALMPGLSYSYIKISDGCSNNCAYCAIPIIRGPHASYPPDLIMADARTSAERGARELVVVAQDISAYQWKEFRLKDIVRDVSSIAGIEWIRLMYCHPDHIDDDIISIFESINKVVPYLDVPFQHVSERVLQSMGRRGNAEAYQSLVRTLRARVPDIRVRSTFMVGYPLETEDDFEELITFLGEARLDRVGAFVYSPEEGTRSQELGDPVPGHVKEERYDRLMALQQKISSQKLASLVGSAVPVLVEEQYDPNTWIGRTCYDAPEVDGIFYLTGNSAPLNSIVSARVTAALEYDLMGEIIR